MFDGLKNKFETFSYGGMWWQCLCHQLHFFSSQVDQHNDPAQYVGAMTQAKIFPGLLGGGAMGTPKRIP